MMTKTAQPDLFNGRERKELGMTVTLERDPGYKDRFHAAAAKILAEKGRLTSSDVTAVIGMPARHNCVGAAMNSFARAHHLKIVCFITSQRATRHAARIAQWQS